MKELFFGRFRQMLTRRIRSIMQGKIYIGMLIAGVAFRFCAASTKAASDTQPLLPSTRLLIFRGPTRGFGARGRDKWVHDYTITRIARVE